NSPFLKRAIEGDDGGNGNIFSLAACTASLSTPANTVTIFDGFFSFAKLKIAPGLAFLAAQPHTELTTTNVVPSALIASSTSVVVCNDLKPAETNSSFIGFTISSGYIILKLRLYTKLAIICEF